MFGDFFHKKDRFSGNIERYDDNRGDRRGPGGSGGGDNEQGNGSKGPNRQNLVIMLLATVIALVSRTEKLRKLTSGRTAWRSISRTQKLFAIRRSRRSRLR